MGLVMSLGCGSAIRMLAKMRNYSPVWLYAAAWMCRSQRCSFRLWNSSAWCCWYGPGVIKISTGHVLLSRLARIWRCITSLCR